MGIDLGKGQIDLGLCNELIALGIKDIDARELARVDAFGGNMPKGWISGLRTAAQLVNGDSLVLDWGMFPAPWDTTCPAIAGCNGNGPHEALVTAFKSYDTRLQIALIGAVGVAVQAAAVQANKKRKTPTVPSATYLRPIDLSLAKALRAVLEKQGKKEQKRKKAGELLIDWLVTNGDFIKTVYGQSYYLHRASRRLFQLGTSTWHTWLYLATSINPASIEFKYLLADCDAAATEGKTSEVVRVAYWDTTQQILRVSRFDGTVYRLDGATIEEEANGDGPALFEDAPLWAPYQPDYSTNGTIIDWLTREIPHWEEGPDECGILFKAWWLATFFTELCPTRPILVAKGEKGSGKSMMLRVLLRLLFGIAADVAGVPDKPDAFTSLVSNSHVVVLDNMDDLTKDIRDKIAALSTGKIDFVRELYTTNEMRTIRYRCWLAVTSRTPDTLQRDDLVDRTIILPVCRIDDSERTRESHFLQEVIRKRNCWWGDTLTVLNGVVAEIRRSGIPDRGGLRMEDWAALGTVIAKTTNQLDVWEKGLQRVKARQSEFLLEENVVVQAVEAWVRSPHLYAPAPQATRGLYEAAKSALYGVDRPDSNWPRSVRSFARQLSGIRRELRTRLANQGIDMHWRILHGNEVYEFIKVTR